jgi:hypothetical protein
LHPHQVGLRRDGGTVCLLAYASPLSGLGFGDGDGGSGDGHHGDGGIGQGGAGGLAGGGEDGGDGGGDGEGGEEGGAERALRLAAADRQAAADAAAAASSAEAARGTRWGVKLVDMERVWAERVEDGACAHKGLAAAAGVTQVPSVITGTDWHCPAACK